MDRVSDAGLDALIDWSRDHIKEDLFVALHIANFNALVELRSRREAERRPDPLSQALNEGDGSYRP